MTRRATNVTPFRQPSRADADDLAQGRAALRFIGRMNKALASSPADRERIVPWCRVSALIGENGPFSKATVYRYIKEKKLDAVRLGGVTLISIESVNKLLKTAEPWTPQKVKGRGKKKTS